MGKNLVFLSVNVKTGQPSELFLTAQTEELANRYYGYSYAYPEGQKEVPDALGKPFQRAKEKKINSNLLDFIVDAQTFKELFEETYFNIYGNSQEQKEEFSRLWGMTQVEPKLAPIFGGFSGATTHIEPQFKIDYLNRSVSIVGQELSGIGLNRMDLTLMIPAAIHEWTHAGLVGKKVHETVFLKEFFSILMERVASIMVATQTKDDEVRRIMEIARTNNIIRNIKDADILAGHIAEKERIKGKYRGTGIDNLAEMDLTILRSQMMQALTYFHSDVYAFAMTKKYLDDPQGFYKKMGQVMKGRLTAEQMLQYYGVSMRSQEMKDMTCERLEDYR